MSRAARGLAVGSALFALYAYNTSGDTGWEDSAFFQLCHAVLGVPHGPGFPLYVILGRVFVWPFGSASAFGSNLFSALAVATAGAVLLEVMLLLGAGRGEETERQGSHWTILSSAAVVLGWATLQMNRQQAARTEVYPLALLLVLLVWYCALRSRQAWGRTERMWPFACAAAWCWGLGMAVHPLIVAASATPWLFYAAWKWRKSARLWILAGLSVLPLSLYLYPPLRGRIPGVWAWGDFTSLGAAMDYFTRRSAWEAVVAVDGGWLENMAGWGFGLQQFWPAGLWIPSVLALWLLRRTWAFGVSLFLVWFLVLWASPYDPSNLDLLGYFLPAIALFAAGVGVVAQRGVKFLLTQLPGLSSRSRLAVGFFLVCLATSWPTAALLSSEKCETRKAGTSQIAEWLGFLPQGATLLVSEDNLLGVLEFETRVRGFRPDLKVVALGALRYPFYRRRLAARLPSEWASLWDSSQIWSQVKWAEEVQRFLSFHQAEGAWYAQYDRLPGISNESLGPHGFLMALSGDTSSSAWEAGLTFWKGQVNSGCHVGQAQDAFARWIFNFGVLALDRGHVDVGWEALLLAVHQSPEDPEIYYLLGQALQRSGRTSESLAMLGAACELAPYRSRYRLALESSSPSRVALP